jgi:hypothetical protein
MAKFLRKLDKAVWWDTTVDQPLETLGSDALKNARTTENELSVFLVNSDDDLHVVLAAITSNNSNKINDADYCLFDGSVFDLAGIKHQKKMGTTGCARADDMHHDLVSLTALSLASFVCHAAHQGELDSIDKKTLATLIKKLVSDGVIDSDKVKCSL